MIAIKLTDELLAKLKAANATDAVAAIENLIASAQAATEAKEAAEKKTSESQSQMKEEIAALEKRITALEAKAQFDPEALKLEVKTIASTEAKMVASQTVSAANATTGTTSVKTEATSDNAKEIAADDYEGQWKANEQLRGEFGGNFGAYVAYQKAMQHGRCKVFGKK